MTVSPRADRSNLTSLGFDRSVVTAQHWYRRVVDWLADTPYLLDRLTWHLIFDPGELPIKLGLALYANADLRLTYWNRRRVMATACILRRAEMGGRVGARARRRFSRCSNWMRQHHVDDAKRLLDREKAVAKVWATPVPDARIRVSPYLLTSTVFGTYFAFAVAAHQWFIAAVIALGFTPLVVFGVADWAWRQGYREAMYQSVQKEAVEREQDAQSWAASMERRERALMGEVQRAEWERLTGLAACELDSRLPHLSKAEPGQGHLYVIRFSTGVVKVGQTGHLRRRLFEHRRDAATFGVNVNTVWVSQPHFGYVRNETRLINACLQVGGRVRREYFHNVQFDVAVGVAASLAACGGLIRPVAVGKVSR